MKPKENKAPRKQRTPANIWKPIFLECLSETHNVLVSCKRAGIDRTTAYKARWRSKRFAEQWKEAEENAIELLEAEVRKRALLGWDEPVWYKGEMVGTVKKKSDTLAMFLLKAHRPHMYRDNMSVQHSGAVDTGQPNRVELVLVPPAPDTIDVTPAQDSITDESGERDKD